MINRNADRRQRGGNSSIPFQIKSNKCFTNSFFCNSRFDMPHIILGLSLQTRHVVTGRQVDVTLAVVGSVVTRFTPPLQTSFVSRIDHAQRERQQHTPVATTSGTNVPVNREIPGETRRVSRRPRAIRDACCRTKRGADHGHEKEGGDTEGQEGRAKSTTRRFVASDREPLSNR